MTLQKQLKDILNDPVKLVQWFMLCRHTGILLSSVVIARSLPLNEVGIFEMLMLSGYLITFFWSEALLKGYLSTTEAKADSSASSSFLWLYMLAGILFLSLLVVGEKVFIPFFTGEKSLEGLGIFAVYQALIIVVWVGPLMGEYSNRRRQILSIFVLTGPPLACWLGFKIGADLHGILLGLVGYAIIGMFLTLKGIHLPEKQKLKTILVMIWPATWPLVMYAVSTGLARSFDSWLVARQFDEAQFAIFRYGAREFPIVVAVAAGLSTVMIPKLLSNDALPELRLRSARLMHICYPIVFVTMLCSPFLFAFFFGEAYKPGAFLFNIYLLLTLTQLVFPQSILTARGDTRLLWYVSLAELLVNVVASLILLSYFGLEGIAMGTLIAFTFEKIVLVIIVSRRYGVQPGRIFNPYVWLGYAGLLLIAFNAAKWTSGA